MPPSVRGTVGAVVVRSGRGPNARAPRCVGARDARGRCLLANGESHMLGTPKKLLLLPMTLLAGGPITACISTTSGIGEATHGCPEFHAGATVAASAKADARVRSFTPPPADLEGLALPPHTAL